MCGLCRHIGCDSAPSHVRMEDSILRALKLVRGRAREQVVTRREHALSPTHRGATNTPGTTILLTTLLIHRESRNAQSVLKHEPQLDLRTAMIHRLLLAERHELLCEWRQVELTAWAVDVQGEHRPPILPVA